MKNEYVVTAYYTVGTLYEKHVERLRASLAKFNVPHDVCGVSNLGDWWKNTAFKPTFLLQMLEKHAPKHVVYVDCDAEFRAYPALFDTFDDDVGVYVFDRSCYKKSAHGTEVLSGTVWLRNCDRVHELVARWARECEVNSRTWDQKCLERVLHGQFSLLPPEYCCIFDTMSWVKEPTIVHYQASREARKRGYRVDETVAAVEMIESRVDG